MLAVGGRAVASEPAEIPAIVTVLDTLVVYGPAVVDPTLPAASSVVTVVELEPERGGADLAELLATVAGLQIRRYGGLGAQAVPSLRGSTGAQVQVLVDGLPLADAQNGAVDIARLPLERFDRAEIHRGIVPAGLGGIGAAGAVNLQTREGAEGAEVRLFTGSFGDVGGRVGQTLSSRDGGRRAQVLVHGRRLDNRYEYTPWIPAWAGDPVELSPRTRANADLEEWGWFGLGEVSGRNGRARVSLGGFRRDGGRPGPQNDLSPTARVRYEGWDGRLGAITAGEALTADLAVNRRVDWLYDPHREVGLDPYERTRAFAEDVLGRLVWTPRLDLARLAGWLPAGGLGLTAGSDWRDQWYRETNDGVDAPRRHRRTVSAFGGLDLQLVGPRLTVSSAWRWQRFRDDLPPVPPLPWLPEEEGVEHVQDAVSPSIGIAWQPLPRRLVVEAHWHESVRQPTWVELFGQPGGLVGNRELAPEEIRGRDLGVRLTLPAQGTQLRVTGFDQRSDGTIIYTAAGPGLAEPLNIGRSRTRGVEVEGAFARGPVDLAVSLTWQDAEDRGGADPTYEGKALPFLSDRTAGLELGCRFGAWRPRVTVLYESENYRDRYNQPIHLAPERTLVSLGLARRWPGGIWGAGHESTVTVEVLNLTGDDVYDVEGYPLPGRSARLSIHWH
ncbi:MAG TPA: TonB-dependent receptor [Candidatus Krumholzibacteria bacterium]|nr:TonB-dependent receptor [Candidatus Krumholzibacteria bacterium]HPD72430.1 TonB-dependent receptor [Candidatus Krumholzibacteria bacterium]HRY40638.1 TonB-dependent receptor [Candidatus Krumholzibacteria bacterium]